MIIFDKFIKMSTCILCLGTIISGSIMAIDNGNNASGNVIQSARISSESESSESESSSSEGSEAEYSESEESEPEYSGSEESEPEYSGLEESESEWSGSEESESEEDCIKECEKLIAHYNLNKKDAERAMKIFKDQIEKGKSSAYAYGYTKIVVVNGRGHLPCDEYATVYEKQIEDGKTKLYADICARIDTLSCIKGEQKKKCIKIYERKMEEGKGEWYSTEYAILRVIDRVCREQADEMATIYAANVKDKFVFQDLYADKYARLKVIDRLTEKQARKVAETYRDEYWEGNPDNAYEYAWVKVMNGLDLEQSVKYLKAYRNKTNKIRDKKVLNGYAILKGLNNRLGFSEEQLTECLEIYKKKIGEGKKENYAIEYASLKITERLFSEEILDKISTMYEQKIYECYNANYAHKYAMLKVIENFSDDQADAYASVYQDKYTETKYYIYEYTNLVMLMKKGLIRTLSDIELEEWAELFEKEVALGRNKIYESEYIFLRIKGYDEEKARLMARIYTREIKIFGRSEDCARRCVDLILNHRMKEELAHGLLDNFEKKIERGEVYAEEYARAIVIDKLSINLAVRRAEICDREFRAGKSQEYAKEYARLAIIYDIDNKPENIEKITKMANLFEQKLINGQSREYAREYVRLMMIEGKSEMDSSIMARVFERYIQEGMKPDAARIKVLLTVRCNNRYMFGEPPIKKKK